MFACFLFLEKHNKGIVLTNRKKNKMKKEKKEFYVLD